MTYVNFLLQTLKCVAHDESTLMFSGALLVQCVIFRVQGDIDRQNYIVCKLIAIDKHHTYSFLFAHLPRRPNEENC